MKTNFFMVIVLIFYSSCYKDVDEYIKKNKYSILSVSTLSDSLAADGKSILLVTAKISNDADLKNVHFLTTDGNFLDSLISYTVSASFENDSLLAHAYLVSSLNVSDNVFLKVSVPGVDTTLKIRFVTAYPDSIHIESPVDIIKNGYNSEVLLQTVLIRKIGMPSLHQYVSFSAKNQLDSTIGEFRGIDPGGSNNSGFINSVFVLRDTTYTGNIKIIASFTRPDTILTSTFSILVTK